MSLLDYENAYSNANFMEIVDAKLFETILEMNNDIVNFNSGMPLAVIQSKGVEVKNDFKIDVNDLNTDGNNMKYKQFINNGDGGITFKIEAIFKGDENWGYGVQTNADYISKGFTYPKSMKKIDWLEFWYINMRPLYVVSEAIDIPNGTYLLTNISSRKQEYHEYTIWNLEFTTYTPLQIHKWTASESVIKATTKKTTTTTKTSSTKSKSLKDCSASKIVYSKTKKTTECNKLMQEKLYKLGFLRKDQIDSWYGPVTMEAVKKFQRWYNKKGHNLLVDGICGAVTLKALIKS